MGHQLTSGPLKIVNHHEGDFPDPQKDNLVDSLMKEANMDLDPESDLNPLFGQWVQAKGRRATNHKAPVKVLNSSRTNNSMRTSKSFHASKSSAFNA